MNRSEDIDARIAELVAAEFALPMDQVLALTGSLMEPLILAIRTAIGRLEDIAAEDGIESTRTILVLRKALEKAGQSRE